MVDWASTWSRLGDHRMNGTRPDRLEPDRHERHAAFRTLARLVLDDVLVALHRADVRDRRQPLRGRTRLRGPLTRHRSGGEHDGDQNDSHPHWSSHYVIHSPR